MEEFTFPPIHQLPFPTTTSTTTSLWLLTPPPPRRTASPSPPRVRRSFSSIEGAVDVAAALRNDFLPTSPSPSDCGGCDGPPLDEEERMDMLWEAFNEELKVPRRSVGFECRERGLLRRGAAAQLRMLPALDASKSARAGEPRYKKPSLLLMLRGFKKLFVVEKAHNTTTTSSSSSSSSKRRFMKQQK